MDPGLASHEAAWRASGIDSYVWQVSYSCLCQMTTPVEITVVDGRVTSVTSLDKRPSMDGTEVFPLTVDSLYEQARETIAGGGAVVATWKAGSDVPATLTLDPIPRAVDDELLISVDSFAVSR